MQRDLLYKNKKWNELINRIEYNQHQRNNKMTRQQMRQQITQQTQQQTLNELKKDEVTDSDSMMKIPHTAIGPIDSNSLAKKNRRHKVHTR
jgi:predicted RNA-binding protein with EMAP domain